MENLKDYKEKPNKELLEKLFKLKNEFDKISKDATFLYTLNLEKNELWEVYLNISAKLSSIAGRPISL